MFYTFKDIIINLNNRPVLVNNLQLSQQNSYVSPYEEQDRTSISYGPENGTIGNLRIQYYLTGQDPLKYYFFNNENEFITGYVGGLYFNSGLLNTYSINLVPNNPAQVNANIVFYTPLTGTLTNTAPITQSIQVLNLYNAILANNTNFSTDFSNNISNINFEYQAEIKPIYSMETGSNVPNISPYRIVVEKRKISTEITSDNFVMNLPYSGREYGMKLFLINPNNTGIQESFECSGRINQKTINGDVDKSLKSSISIEQNHVNDIPSIRSTSFNPVSVITPYNLTITGLNLLSTNSVKIGDENCTINSITNNTISISYTPNVINDYIYLDNPKGRTISSFIQQFTFSGIRISGTNVDGININTGDVGTQVLITGSNFYRISDVQIGDGKCPFALIGNTGIKTVITSDVTTGPIKVISQTRNLTGVYNTFFVPPKIYSIYPGTGITGSLITISGANFSGINRVFFNGISGVFASTTLNLITGTVPSSGRGFTKGFITVSTNLNLTGISLDKYQPLIPILDILPRSGKIYETGVIKLKYFDRDFLNEISGIGISGYKVSYNYVTGTFYVSGNLPRSGILTGIIPSGNLNGYVTIYEPDGVTTYPSFTGKFDQIGPAPFVTEIQPYIINLYKYNNIAFRGQNLLDFFGQSSYLQLRAGQVLAASPDSSVIYPFSIVSGNSFGNKAIFPYVRITGTTGYYNATVINAAGSDLIESGIYVRPPINEAQRGLVIHAAGLTSNPPSYAVDVSGKSYSAITGIIDTYHGASWWCTFKENIIVSRLNISQTNVPSSLKIKRTNYRRISNVDVSLCNEADQEIFFTGLNFARAPSLHTGISFLARPITGARFLKLSSVDTSSTTPQFMGFSNVEVL